MNVSILPLLLFYNFIAKNLSYSLIIGAVCLIFYKIKNKAFVPLVIPAFLSSFDVIFSLPFLVMLDQKEKYASKKCVFFVFSYVLSFVALSLLDYSIKSYVIYFYGIPATIILSFIVFFLFKEYKYNKLICFLLIFIVIICSIYGKFNNSSNGLNIGITDNKESDVITNNSLKNSSYCCQCKILKFNDAFKLFTNPNNRYSIFLPEYKENIEDLISENKSIKGIFYLYGEHDNYLDFIKNEKTKFKNDYFQRSGPWHIKSFVMERELQLASYLDYFLCSNIGTTLKISYDILPVAWAYTKYGVPKIIIGKKLFKEKQIYYIADSDPFVSFLAPYNTYFLSSLYGYFNKIDIFRAILLIFIVVFFISKRYNKYIIALIYIVLCLTYLYKWENKQQFDYNFHTDAVILSPHVENDISSFVKELSRNKKTVSVNSVKNPIFADIYIVNNKIKITDNNKNNVKIFFITSSGELFLNEKKYTTIDIPQGKISNIVDALYIKNENTPFLKIENNIIIGTNSPQRNCHLLEILQ